MPRASEPLTETVLPTGWRITGRQAEAIAQRVTAELERLRPGAVRDTLYAVQFTSPISVRGRTVVELALDELTDEVRHSWPECPRLVRDQPVERPASRFGGLHYEAEQAGKTWLGDLTWHAVHPVVAGAPITTSVLLEETPSFVRISVRVTADGGLASVRGYVGAGQAQPAFLRSLGARVPLTWLGGPLGCLELRAGGVAPFVGDVLASARAYPVVVLAPYEDGTFAVPPDSLLWELFGRARLYLIEDHRQTFELSDAVGDPRMSCYWGAARCYLPRWSRHDDPLEHPLLLADRLEDPVLRAAWLGEIGLWLGSRLELPPSLEERREAAAAAAAPPPPPAPAETAEPAEGNEAAETTSPAPQLLHDVLNQLQRVNEVMARLADEVERLRTISAVRASSTNAIERRLGRVEDLLERLLPAPAAAAAAPLPAADTGPEEPGLVDVVQNAATSHADALVFLGEALAAAEDSPYEDPERVRAVLDAMARVARRRRDGLLGTSLREAFADLGLDYRPGIARSTPARLREQYCFAYRSGTVEAEEHIALGATYDPRRCLRVYFSSRVPNDPRFVIAHVGRHFEVMTST